MPSVAERTEPDRRLTARRTYLVGFALSALFVSASFACGSKDARVAMPSLKGLTEQQARSRLAELGSSTPPVRVEYKRAGSTPLGRVASQEPKAGTKLSAQETVTFVVAIGPDAPVPDLTKMARSKALRTLADAGFGARLVLEASTSVPAGAVLRTKPGSGEETPTGTVVVVVVSSGGTRIKMPNVVGRDGLEAAQALTELGLEVAVKQEPSTRPSGTVLRQGPKAGRRIASGSKVTLVVAVPIDAGSTSTIGPGGSDDPGRENPVATTRPPGGGSTATTQATVPRTIPKTTTTRPRSTPTSTRPTTCTQVVVKDGYADDDGNYVAPVYETRCG